MSFRIGQGIDVHPFAEARPLVLGGVRLSEEGGLEGHSDADALLHAVTDAILGACAAGDIGEFFPSTDARWRGADSATFVRHALERLEQDGGRIGNVDVTIIAQKPKLAPHRQAMRDSLAALLRLPAQRVSVKATTTDHLGFVGRAEGICAIAVVLCEFD